MSVDTKERAGMSTGKRLAVGLGLVIIIVLALVILTPETQEGDFGVISVIPAVFLLIYIFWTKRILESLIFATVLGLVIVHKGGFFSAFMDSLLGVGMEEDTVWLFVVCV